MKKIVAPVIAVLVILSTGVAAFYGTLFVRRHLAEVEAYRRLKTAVYFGVVDAENRVTMQGDPVPIIELEGYQSVFSDASGSYYLRKLPYFTGTRGTLVYHAILYALDHGYSLISLPTDGLDKEQVDTAALFAVLDQPMLEENSGVLLRTSLLEVGNNSLSCYQIILPHHDEEHLARKKEALEAARRWVADIPAELKSDRARAQWLFERLVRFARYTDDEKYNDTNPHYLYDALVTGVTNCDGFSNAYTMLMNLAGIECFNVISYPEGEGEGHTWNVMRIDGVYYQADPTAEATAFNSMDLYLNLCFCRSAAVLGNDAYDASIAEAAPACEDTRYDLENVDAVISSLHPSGEEYDALERIIYELECGAPYAVIRCDSFMGRDLELNMELMKDWLRNDRMDLLLSLTETRYCIVKKA